MGGYRDEILKRAAERRQQAAAAESYADVKNKTISGDIATGQRDALKTVEKMKATADLDPKAAVYKHGAPVRSDRMLVLERVLADKGILAVGEGPTAPKYGADFERARATPGARDIVIGDRPAVVTERGALLAYDAAGSPGVLENFGAIGKGGSPLGAVSNALVRPQQAVFSGIGAVARGKNPLSAAADAFAGNTGGKTIADGGDVVPSAVEGGIAAGLDPETALMLGLPVDLIADPMNLVGAGVPAKLSKLTARANKAARATKTGARALDAVDEVRAVVREKMGMPTSESDAARAIAKAPLVDESGELARTVSEAPSIAAARSARGAEANLKTIEQAKGLVPKGSDRAVFDAAESSIKHMETPGEIVTALRKLDETGIAPDSARSIAALKSMPAVHLNVLTGYEADAARIEARLQAARAAANGAQAATEAKNLERLNARFMRTLKPYAAHLNRAYAIAEDAGVPLALVRGADKLGDVDRSAALLSSMNNRMRETMGELDILKNAEKMSRNYMPHAIEGADFTPWKKRSLVATDEMERLREEVLTSAGGGANIDKNIVEAFASGDPTQMAGMRQQARAISTRPPPNEGLQSAEEALSRSAPDAKFSEDPFWSTAKSAESMQFAETRARTGKILSEAVDDTGRPLAIGLADFAKGVASGSIKGFDSAARKAAGRASILGSHRPRFMGLKGTPEVKGWDLSSSTKELLRRTGYELVDEDVARKMPALKGKVIPKEVAREVKQLAGSLEPGALEKAASWIAGVNKYWAPLVLSTPGFHIRNAMYGMFQIYLDVGAHVGNPKIWALAQKIASTAEHGGRIEGVVGDIMRSSKLSATDLASLVDEVKKLGVVETGRTADLASLAQSSLRYKGESRPLSMINPASKNFLPARAARTVGAEIPARLTSALTSMASGAPKMMVTGQTASLENIQRTVVFLARRLKMNASALEARQHVMKSTFDYTGMRLSSVEKGLRKIFPFYQWMRFSLQQSIEAMIEQPARFSNIQKVFRDFESAGGEDPQFSDRFTPDYVRQRGGLKMPKGMQDTLREMGIGTDKSTSMRWMVERPGAQLNQDFKKLLGEALGPGAKIPMETFLSDTPFGTDGKYLFGGGDISPGFVEGEWNSTLENAMNMDEEDILPYLLSQMGAPPALVSRYMIGGAGPRNTQMDERDKLLQTIVSMMTGQKIATFDPREVQASEVAKGNKVLQDVNRGRMTRARRSPGAFWSGP